LVLVVVIGGGLLALWVLTSWAGRHQGGMSAEASATLRLDAIKTALTVAAGLGAGVTLIMALRRQSISERSQHHIEEDSREQRITTLYVAAAEQLGSEKAAVRLAGLYALERLGQDNPKLRQTVIDVICAYLRMPYTPPTEILRGNAQHSPHTIAKDDPDPEPEQQPERRQESQVRLTAQRLLRDHTKASEPGSELMTYWRGQHNERMNLDLTGAVLVSFDLADCQSETAVFASAQFHGHANLRGAQFHGHADLRGAQFHGNANLSGAQFHDTNLGGAQFHGGADLNKAQFHGNADLRGAQFHGNANLFRAQFHGDAYLGAAQFHGHADLGGAQFHGNAYLSGAQFHGYANLGGAKFHGGAVLDAAQFHGNAYLGAAQFHGYANLRGAQFHGGADLNKAQFHGYAYLGEAQFHGDANLGAAQFHAAVELTQAQATERATLPPRWVLAPDTGNPLRSIVRVRSVTENASVPPATAT
jgi:uncharacterized protein YjbI with pentapeptide repeats